MDQRERSERAKVIEERARQYRERLRDLRHRQRQLAQTLIHALEGRKTQEIRKQLGLP